MTRIRHVINKSVILTLAAFVMLGVSFNPSTFSSISNLSLASHCPQGNPEGGAPNTPVRIPTSSEEFGDQVLFWAPLNWPEDGTPVQYRATLLSVGDECYVYMANDTIEILGEEQAISKCNNISQIFDEVIYPKGVELAGNPDGNLGDVDGDPRVTVFLGSFQRHMSQAYLGFYIPEHEVASTYSNYREMVFVDGERDLNTTVCTTIHEFNHLIWGNYELDDAEFLTEGLANVAVVFSGYYFQTTHLVTTSFTHYPQVSLLYFNRFYSNYWDASYGQAYLFMTYLYERFGVDFCSSLVATEEDGAQAIDVALSNHGYDLTFNDVYFDWVIACALDNTEIEDGRYGFTSVNYTVDHQSTLGYDYPDERVDITHYYYGMHVKKVSSPPEEITFQIENPRLYSIGIATAVRDNSGWTVSKSIRNGLDGVFLESIQGDDVEEIYIITCLMSENTPTEFGIVYALDEIPSMDLDYTIYEGYTSGGTQQLEMWVYLIPLIGVGACVLGIIAIIHRKKVVPQ